MPRTDIKLTRIILLVMVINVSTNAYAGWKDILNIFKKEDGKTATTEIVSSITNEEIIAGLKEALGKGTKTAVNFLGKTDGFLANPDVRIPMPSSLQKIERSLRLIGQDKYANAFIETMNRAAEQAVPVAIDVFSDAIREMTIIDAKNILTGSDDAATRYFEKTSSVRLKQNFLPIVKSATDKVGLTSSYKNLIGKLGPLTGFMDTSSLDLDNYVANKALDGLFLIVAREEKKIRENPVERTTDLLKKVFSQTF